VVLLQVDALWCHSTAAGHPASRLHSGGASEGNTGPWPRHRISGLAPLGRLPGRFDACGPALAPDALLPNKRRGCGPHAPLSQNGRSARHPAIHCGHPEPGIGHASAHGTQCRRGPRPSQWRATPCCRLAAGNRSGPCWLNWARRAPGLDRLAPAVQGWCPGPDGPRPQACAAWRSDLT